MKCAAMAWSRPGTVGIRCVTLWLGAMLVPVCGCTAIQRFLVPPPEPKVVVGTAQSAAPQRAEVVLMAGSVEGEAGATVVALRGDRVLAVGAAADVTPLMGDTTTVIRARGAHISRGFVDAHVQLEHAAMREDAADLSGVRTPAELTKATRTAQTIMGEWLWGTGLSAEGYDAMTAEAIDAALPEIPAWLSRADGLAARLTTPLVQKLPPDLRTAVQAAGGKVEGLLAQRAWRALPPMRPTRLRPLVRRVLLDMVQRGVTEVHAMGASAALAEAVGYLDLMGQLPARVRVFYDVERPEAAELLAGRAIAFRGAMAHLAGIEIWLDGDLAGRTAALSAPYADANGGQGTLRYDEEALRELISGADAQRLQVAVHAAGDAALAQILRVVQAMQRPATALPVRIVGARVIPETLLAPLQDAAVECTLAPRQAAADAATIAARLGAARMPWTARGLTLSRWCTLRSSSGPTGSPADPLADWRALAATPAVQLSADATPGDAAQLAWAAVTQGTARDRRPAIHAGDRADLTIWSSDPTAGGAAPVLLWTVISGSVQAASLAPK